MHLHPPKPPHSWGEFLREVGVIAATLIKTELPRAYRAPNRSYTNDIWKNAVSTGVIGHMAADHVSFLSAQYYEVEQLERLQDREADASSRLAALADDAELSPDSRVALQGELGNVDWINALTVRVARDLLEDQRKAQQHYDRAATERGRREVLRYERAIRGTCIADLPLDLG